ncbi:hypothetical protein CPB83DRAFT_851547, partial [Crepidotus variabilis]
MVGAYRGVSSNSSASAGHRQGQGQGQGGRAREQTHLMFSHTIKGQKYNMPLLGRFLDSTRMTMRGVQGSSAPLPLSHFVRCCV